MSAGERDGSMAPLGAHAAPETRFAAWGVWGLVGARCQELMDCCPCGDVVVMLERYGRLAEGVVEEVRRELGVEMGMRLMGVGLHRADRPSPPRRPPRQGKTSRRGTSRSTR